MAIISTDYIRSVAKSKTKKKSSKKKSKPSNSKKYIGNGRSQFKSTQGTQGTTKGGY